MLPYGSLVFTLPSSRGGYGYIVMEYIDGSICDKNDVALVAAAVQSLISVQCPTRQPGPVGGGPIGHRFFVEWNSSLTYPSVALLEAHINGVSVPLRPRTFAGLSLKISNRRTTDFEGNWA